VTIRTADKWDPFREAREGVERSGTVWPLFLPKIRGVPPQAKLGRLQLHHRTQITQLHEANLASTVTNRVFLEIEWQKDCFLRIYRLAHVYHME
jgi:hypothetical protein